MATRQPFWKRHSWKSIGFCLLPQRTRTWILKLKFLSKLDLRSGNHAAYAVQKPKNQYGHPAAILKMTSLKINRLLPIYTSIGPLKLPVHIQSQTTVRVWRTKKSNIATRQPFWKWHRWKSIDDCLWPPSTFIWNLKLKSRSKLELHSGNHATYRVQRPKNPIWPPVGHFERDIAGNR